MGLTHTPSTWQGNESSKSTCLKVLGRILPCIFRNLQALAYDHIVLISTSVLHLSVIRPSLGVRDVLILKLSVTSTAVLVFCPHETTVTILGCVRTTYSTQGTEWACKCHLILLSLDIFIYGRTFLPLQKATVMLRVSAS